MNIFLNFYIEHMNPRERAKYYNDHNIIKMGENCEIFTNVIFGEEHYLIELGNNVKIASGVKLLTADKGIQVASGLMNENDCEIVGPITIGNNVFIGMSCTILPNVKIGNNVVVGAHSVITSDVPDNTVVAGNPAKTICSIEQYFEKNKEYIHSTQKMSQKDKKDFYTKLFNK